MCFPQSATKWLHDKLEASNVPCPNEAYMKAKSFNGVVFAKYCSSLFLIVPHIYPKCSHCNLAVCQYQT